MGTNHRERLFIINDLISKTGLPRRRFFDSNNEPIRMKGLRDQYYYDIGLSPNTGERDRRAYDEIKIELDIGRHTEFIVGESL